MTFFLFYFYFVLVLDWVLVVLVWVQRTLEDGRVNSSGLIRCTILLFFFLGGGVI